MKRLLLFFALVSALVGTQLLAPGTALAQRKMTKKELKREKKKWKKIAKKYKKNPLALKAHEEAYQKQIEGLTQKNNDLTQRYTELQAEMDSLLAVQRSHQTRFDSLSNEYERMKSAYEILKEQANKPQEASIPGLVFRVQIGAYEFFDMSRHYGETGENFSGENVDNLNKYLIGRFRSYDNAQAFRDDIRKLGIRDAFIVAYNDGTRIDIKEALRIQNGGAPAGGDGRGSGDGGYDSEGGGGGEF